MLAAQKGPSNTGIGTMRIFVIVLAVCTAFASLFVLRSEVATASVLRELHATPVPLGPQSKVPPIWTAGEAHGLILACLEALSPDVAQLLPPRLARQSRQVCDDLAGQNMRARPTDARSYMLRAAVAARSGQIERQLDDLHRAARLAPFEGWQAEHRLVALFAMPSEVLSPEQTKVQARLVLQAAEIAQTTQNGAELLAAYFVQRPKLRTLLRTAFERAGPADRTRVFNLIRLQGNV